MGNILITGGCGTIGSAIAKRFLTEDNNIFILDNLLKNQIKSNNIEYIKCDVSNISEIKSIVYEKKIPKMINHLVTVAGGALVNEWSEFSKVDIETVKKSVELNLFGHINIIHEILQFMTHGMNGGSITMISSINAKGCYGLAGYSAAKAGLEGFMYSVAKELANMNIRINIVSPGTVVSGLSLSEDKKDWERLKEGCLLEHFTEPNDIAEVVNMISYNKSIVGQNIIIDCGQSIKRK